MYCDLRLGPPGRWTNYEPEDSRLRLPDHVKNCVCFICVQRTEMNHSTAPPTPVVTTIYAGTAFFISMRSKEQPRVEFSYLATAKHCVLRAYKEFGHLKVRINKQGDQEAAILDVRESEWVFPEDPGVDVAVLPVMVPRELRVFCLNMESMLNETSALIFGVGIGDDTTTIGLYSKREGKNANIPILRGGIISAMPDENIRDPKTGAIFRAYLIEVRSIGGLSGSPVLVHIPPHRCIEDRERVHDGMSIPLGVIRGHWNIETTQQDWSEDFASPLEQIHSGIAMVTPIEEVTNVIMNSKKLKVQRHNLEEALVKGDMMVEDSNFGEREEPPFTREDFEAALRKASRRIQPSQSDEEK
jgi:hypothetical protein